MAVANYHDQNGHYPPPYIAGPDGRPWHSWRILILPFIEHNELYEEYDFAQPWDGPNNRKLAERIPRLFVFHGSERKGPPVTNYLAVVGEETVWSGTRLVSEKDVKDGTGMTIVLVENLGAGVHWMEPRDLVLDEGNLGINTPKGISSPYVDPAVATLDTAVFRLRPHMEPRLLRAMLTIRGGELVEYLETQGWTLLPDGRLRSLREP